MEPVKKSEVPQGLSGKLTILHAGSLRAPFGSINEEFQRLNPSVELVTERGGSADLIRDVVKGRECGVLASADYSLIPKLMNTKHANWYITFASNNYVLGYTDKSKYRDEINEKNWYEILQRNDVTFWRFNPDGDPGGYRVLMVFQLAERYYQILGLCAKLMNSASNRLITPATFQETKSGYMFLYGSNLSQNGLKHISLPDQINLSNPKFADYYRRATVTISGNSPQEKIVINGEPIMIGLTIPNSFTNQKLAVAWVSLLLSKKGRTLMQQTGLPQVNPALASELDKVPEALKKYLKQSPEHK